MWGDGSSDSELGDHNVVAGGWGSRMAVDGQHRPMAATSIPAPDSHPYPCHPSLLGLNPSEITASETTNTGKGIQL